MADLAANQQRLTKLFAGPHPGHLVMMLPTRPTPPGPGDCLHSPASEQAWVDHLCRAYETEVTWQERLGDDAVPYAKIGTGTQVHAAMFGCPVHVFDDTPPAALPLVTTAAEAARLQTPDLGDGPLSRWFRIADAVSARLGPDVPIGVADMQSPFDIAALVWRKEDLLLALYQAPAAVEELVARCHDLICRYLDEVLTRYRRVNLCHCPYAWAPPELGLWLSEDEAGTISAPMFAQFCLPWLNRLSERYGGLFMHCCAAADHQYANFAAIGGLRALNRVFQYPEPGHQPAIDRFSGQAVLMMGWLGEARAHELLDAGGPTTRWLLNVNAPSLEAAEAIYQRVAAHAAQAPIATA